MSDSYAIECHGVTKAFGGIQALKGCDISVKEHTIHAIIGENGAGKSTLMKILSGIYTRDSGDIKIFGKEVKLGNPRESMGLGIGIIYQEFSLVPDLSVAENIFLDDLKQGGVLVSQSLLRKKAKAALDEFGFDLDPTTRVGDLPVAWQQILEITKALAHKTRILILDEPTAVLAGPEVDRLFEILHRLKNEGVTIIYISHRLEELFRISDAITVIKDGQTVVTLDPKTTTQDEVISNMVGRPLSDMYPPRHATVGEEIFRVEDLNRKGVLENISFSIRAGEVVGMAGLMGSGRTEVLRAVFGFDHATSGRFYVDGKEVKLSNAKTSIRAGLGFVPEDRKNQGLVLKLPIIQNMTMANLKSISRFGMLDRKKEAALAEKYRNDLKIRMGSPSNPVESLSGGNQQKVVLAKWIHTDSHILFLDEPTRGVDVGAKVEIYQQINQLAEAGYGILMVSSELPELIGVCDRIMVMSDGHLAGVVSGEDMTEEKIMNLAIPKRARKTGDAG